MSKESMREGFIATCHPCFRNRYLEYDVHLEQFVDEDTQYEWISFQKGCKWQKEIDAKICEKKGEGQVHEIYWPCVDCGKAIRKQEKG